jgi:MFS family permease
MSDSSTEALVQKVLRRLIPFCILCYLLNYIDRSNIAIAEHSMRQSIPDFTHEVYTTGVTLFFFLPYCLFELPSNLLMKRVGPRRWIARIMISWGIVSACLVFTRGPWSFYLLRALLGLAEAGFFPGILLYLSYWIPHAYRARATGLFFLSQAMAQFVGNVIGSSILYVADKYQFPGHAWQWLFLVEGIPTIIVGVVVLFYLTEQPRDAQWLSAEERARLSGIMADERRQISAHRASDFAHALRSPYTWLLSALYGLAVWAYLPVNFFTPEILMRVLSDAHVITLASPGMPATDASATPEYLVSLYVGLLSAIPFGAAALTMLLVARRSDRRNERPFHMAGACAVMVVGLLLAATAPRFTSGSALAIATLAGLSLTAMGFFGNCAVFWAVPPQLLTGTAVAAALAIINALGNLFGTSLGGQMRIWLHLDNASFMMLAAVCAALATVGALTLRLGLGKLAGNRQSGSPEAASEACLHGEGPAK